MRALALNNLSRFEEALYETCLAISLDKMQNLSSTELFQHDLTKVNLCLFVYRSSTDSI